MLFSEAKRIFDRLGINNFLQEKFKKQCSVIIDDRIEKGIEALITFEEMSKILRFPPSWNGVFPIENYVPVPMHSIGLGGVKTELSIIKKFLVSKRCLSELSEVVQTPINQVSMMHLSWLKILPYHHNGDFGSYVSENYFALSRVQIWFYLHMKLISTMFESNYNFPDDNLTIQQRNVPQLQNWLLSRDISITSIDGDKHRKIVLVQLVTRLLIILVLLLNIFIVHLHCHLSVI